METKTHYRKVFKSDHLSSADLEDFLEQGIDLIFTIKCVKQEIGVSVAGRTGDFNIAYFIEPIKPMVLNATNSKIIKSFCNNSPFVEDWKDVRVCLYIDSTVKMKGETVGGIRINKTKPKPKVTEWLTEQQFLRAMDADKKGILATLTAYNGLNGKGMTEYQKNQLTKQMGLVK